MVSSLPHLYLFDEVCQTLEGMPKNQVNFDLYIWLTLTFKIKMNNMFAMEANCWICAYIINIPSECIPVQMMCLLLSLIEQ